MGFREKSTCRRCINEKYDIDLGREDCVYHTFVQPCAVCKQMAHIVVGLRFGGKVKYFFRKRRKKEDDDI